MDDEVSVRQFCGVVTIIGCCVLALGGCESAYTVAQQKLASGDYQGAETALGQRTDKKAKQLRTEIEEQHARAEIAAHLKSAGSELESGQYVKARGDYASASNYDDFVNAG